MPHIAIIGDSVFDNAAYVGGGPAVSDQVEAILPPGWSAELLARDGAVVSGVERQVRAASRETTHAVVSIGGNDALGASGLIAQPARSVADALERIDAVRSAFAIAYADMLDMVLAAIPRAAFCTIYDPNYPDPLQRRLSITALCALNDAILRAAFSRGAPVIDLRLVCDAPADFANPIEPSARGGAKIAAALVRAAAKHDFETRRSGVFIR